MAGKKLIVMTHAGGSPHHGPNMRWYFLAQALKALDVDVEIVSASYFHKYQTPPKVQAPVEQERIDGILYHWIRTTPYRASGMQRMRNQLDFVYGCYRHIPELVRAQPDVVIASSPHPLVAYPAVKVARRAGARFVYESRDLWPALLLELSRFPWWHPYVLLLRAAERYGVRHADRIVSVKPGEGEYFQARYGVDAGRFSWIPNGFLPGEEMGSAPETLADIRVRYRFIVGYVGALSEWYGLDDLMELAGRFRDRDDVAFVLIGKGDLTGALEGRVARNGLRHVYILGPVERNTVQGCLSEFDICYIGMKDMAINRYGISSNKIYEYMYAGKPILACYSVGHDPVREAGCGITVSRGDPEELVGGLERLLSDARLRAELGARGREYFEANHRFDAVARKLFAELI